ncbi:MAG TPA: hypothetical protein VE714_01395, partial [Gemmatimonadales bacterium]|nr:hypothetical protein [Gemmatimonadales bacterium]
SRPQTTVQTWSVTFGAVRLRPPADSQGLPLSFERRLTGIHGTTARYELTVAQPREVPIDAVVAFSPQADSAIVYVDGALFSRYSWLDHWGIAIPFAHPGAQIRIVAWSSVRADSATLRIVTWPPHAGQNADARRYIGRTEAALHVSMRDTLAPMVATIEVPAAKGGTAAASVAAGPLPVSVPPLPPVPVPPMPAADGAAMIAHDTVVVAPARPRTGPDGQTTEQLAAVVQGPGVEIFSPGDGAVLTNDHAYIGVKGEPSEAVVLYDGVTRIDSARTRIDGVLDFIAVPLARGPHRLRVAVTNSWGHVRWDSIAVHVTGLPARFELSSDTVQLVGDGRSTVVVSARVLDGWGVPVVQPAYVTVSAKGATPLGADADASSVGLQLLSSATGRLAVALRPGRVIGPGQLELKSGDARATVALDVLPEVRGLTVAGSGMVGAGATPDAYGALTARGRIDSRTSFTVGVDSRRLNDGRNAFARSADPLEESQYPILGDGSAQQAHTASQSWFSGRLERGYDWAMFGDLATNDFANGLSLAQYRRSVTGVAAHLTTGAISWSAFGSLTAQSLRQLQIRGAGISGPYQIASDVVPGTDNVRVETRDHLNPERTVQSQAMIRFVDYQVDYADGVLLFKQPIPAMDPDGNPVFIVVTFEGATSGDQRLLAGARAALDVRRLLGPTTRLDSVRLGVTAVNADQAIDRYRLVGSDLRLLRVGAIDVAAEVAYAERGDSTGIASSAKASYTLFGGALTLGGSYMQVGREFINPSNLALRPGLTEATVRTGLRVGSTELRAEHAYEAFQVQGVDRRHSRVGVVQHIGTRLQVEGGVAKDQVSGAALPASDMTAADLRASWAATSRLRFWSEGRRHLSLAGPELAPELWGVGLTYQVLSGVSLEASERYVTRPDSQRQYSVSSIGLRADMGHGTQAWGSYQLTGGMSGAGNAAIIGLRNRLQVTPELAVNVLFERRQGVGNASVSDPVRALPFLQTEGDYWSAGAGIELLPKQAPYRLTARGEYKDGSLQSTRLATVSGDVALAASLALLTRQEFAQNALAGAPLARRLSSLWGVAFRPARTDRLNLLAKFQWTEDRNPVGGGVLVARGEERKLIAAGELIWTPLRALELSTRYAVRRTQAERMYADSTPQTLTAWADYLGGRINVNMSRWLSVRSDGRFLMERTTGATAWDASPALVLHPVNGLEIASGYRFGNLSDPDFSVRGGHGAFVTLSATISEKLIPTAAAFWRNRF